MMHRCNLRADGVTKTLSDSTTKRARLVELSMLAETHQDLVLHAGGIAALCPLFPFDGCVPTPPSSCCRTSIAAGYVNPGHKVLVTRSEL